MVVQFGSVANIDLAPAGGSVDPALLPGLAAKNHQAKRGVQIIGHLRAFLRGCRTSAQLYNDAMQPKDLAQRERSRRWWRSTPSSPSPCSARM